LKHHDVIGLGEGRPHLTFVDPDTTRGVAEQLEYDERLMRFCFNAGALQLTPNQFRLLRELHRQQGRVCTREQLAEAVWGASYAPGMEATTLDRLISTLRGVLRRAEAPADLLMTRPGLGYLLNA
jgi:DNA-binding response OmpR family regulator